MHFDPVWLSWITRPTSFRELFQSRCHSISNHKSIAVLRSILKETHLDCMEGRSQVAPPHTIATSKLSQHTCGTSIEPSIVHPNPHSLSFSPALTVCTLVNPRHVHEIPSPVVPEHLVQVKRSVLSLPEGTWPLLILLSVPIYSQKLRNQLTEAVLRLTFFFLTT